MHGALASHNIEEARSDHARALAESFRYNASTTNHSSLTWSPFYCRISKGAPSGSGIHLTSLLLAFLDGFGVVLLADFISIGSDSRSGPLLAPNHS